MPFLKLMHPSMPIILLVALSLIVNFTNTSTNSISFFWDFDNGSTSILNNPSATFINPGFYTIKLVANGATGSDSIISIDYIQVLDKPSASFKLQRFKIAKHILLTLQIQV